MFSPALSALWCFSHAISHAIWPVLVVPVMQLVDIVHLQMGMAWIAVAQMCISITISIDIATFVAILIDSHKTNIVTALIN